MLPILHACTCVRCLSAHVQLPLAISTVHTASIGATESRTRTRGTLPTTDDLGTPSGTPLPLNSRIRRNASVSRA